jgi:hypothetical protein
MMASVNWGSFIDKKIQEAMDDGEFDDLKGMGKPLRLDENMFEEEGKWAAHHLLKEHGFTLPWIAKKKEIETALARAATPLEKTYTLYLDRIGFRPNDQTAIHMWNRAQDEYRGRIAGINQQINDYNLMVPSDSFRMLNVYPDIEIRKLTSQK